MFSTSNEERAVTPWKTVTVADIAEKVAMGPFGSSIKVETFVSSGIPIISGQHLRGTKVDDLPGHNFITDEHAEKLTNANVQRGDIVFTHAGNIGQVAYIPQDSCYERYVISQRQFCMRCNRTKAIPEFVAYYFKSFDGQHKLLANASQVGVPSIARPVSYLRSIEIPLPPIKVQRAIAQTLGTIDDKIELNRRMNRTLEALAQAIFKDWFVDFGPVSAKLIEADQYLSSELWDQFPELLDDDGIPLGWELKPLDDIADFLNGLALQKFPAINMNDKLPVIKIAELRNGITAKSNEASSNLPREYVIRDGDFLFSWSGSLLAKFWTHGEGALNQHLFKVSSKKFPSWFFSQWIYHYLPEFRRIAASKATTMGHIQRHHLTETRTVCPPDNVISLFGETLGPIVERTIKNKLENRTLVEIRDALLPKLISGEIRIKDAEKIVESVA